MVQDIRIKRATFINKIIDLNQEFDFTHPLTKIEMNLIYNFHFTGNPLWDLFTKEAIMLENTWNTAVRLMFDLPLETHRFLIEPISQTKHLKFVLLERFLNFLKQIENSPKKIPKQLLSFIKHDVRSTTGSNLRNILLMTNKSTINDVTKEDIKTLKYKECEPENAWKIVMVKELVEVRNNQLRVKIFENDELDEILTFLCTS